MKTRKVTEKPISKQERYKATDCRNSYGLFGDLTQPMDLGEWFPWEDETQWRGWRHFQNLPVTNIQSNC